MFIGKKHLSRRTVLRGAGAAIALPLLDAMIPAGTALAQTAARPKPKLGFFYLPHGAIMNNTRFGEEMNRWTPSAAGRDFDLKPILTPFAPLKKYLTVVSGLGNKPAESSAVHAIVPVERSARPEHPYANALPEGARVEDRGEAGVFLIQKPDVRVDKDGKPLPSPDVIETRVDSRQDAELRRLGVEPWYAKYLGKSKSK